MAAAGWGWDGSVGLGPAIYSSSSISGYCGWGVAVGGDDSGIARAWPGWLAGADELDAEVPLVAVVEQEQEQELLVGGSLGDGQVLGGVVLGVTEGIIGQQSVFTGAIPGLAAQEERPQVRVVEPKGEGDGVAEVGQGVGASYSVTSCDLRILMDHPTESISSHDPPSRRDDRWFGGPER